MSGLIERTKLSGSVSANTAVASSGHINLGNCSNFAVRSATAQVLTMFAAESENGTYTIANNNLGQPITVTTIANQWVQMNVDSFPYVDVKFQAATSTANVQWVGKG